jgi:tetratricopeptide (TPR) repeat protein
MRKILLFFMFVLFCAVSEAQQRITDPYVMIDTLKAQISRERIVDKKIFLTIRLAISYKSVGNYEEGLKKAKEAVLLAEENKSNRLASAYNMVGVFNKDLGNYDEAIKIYEKVLWLVKASNDSGGIASTYNNLANIYSTQGQLNRALDAYHEALNIYLKIGSKDGAGIAYNNIGETYMDQGKYPEALTNLFAAYNLFAEIEFVNGLAAAQNNIGDIYRNQGNYPESSKYLFGSLKNYEAAKDDAGRALAYTSLGNLYADESKYDEALKYYQSALDLNQKIKDKKGIADALSNVGFIYLKKGQYNESLTSHLEAMKIQEELEYKQGLATSMNNIAIIYKEQGKYDESLKNLFASLNISQQLEDKNAIADTHNNIASVYLEQAKKSKNAEAKQQFKEALNYYNKGLTVAKESGLKKLMGDSYQGQAEIFEKANDFKKAYEYRSLYSAIKDSLVNNETSQKLESLRIQYEVQRAQAAEKAKQEKQKAEMVSIFDRREDSIKYQQKITSLQLSQQTFISKQQEQDLKLKQASLDLANKQNELNRLNYLKSQTELGAEQIKREEKENELTIANQEKSLQSSQLSLQQTQLNLKESQIQAERKQRLFYMGGIVLLLSLFVLIYRNTKNRQRSERLISTERLKSEKAKAAHKMAELELQSLRAQLNPHFMFNSLNAIQELILKEDNDNSHLYLSRFSELLRMLLDSANQPFVSLRKEISLLELYLSLENLRIPDLKYTIEIDPSIDSNRISIPNMMLQPYIENAIWHGLSHKKGERNLNIKIKRKGDNVVCEVEDNGVGRKMSAELKSLYRKEHRSRGMELLSKRFNLLSKEYGADIQTTVEDLHDNGTATGTRVAISVPYSLTEQAKPVY